MSVAEIQKMIEEEESRLASIQDHIDGLKQEMIQYQARINVQEITKIEIQTNMLNLERDLVTAKARELRQQNASSVHYVTASPKKVNRNETIQLDTPIFRPWLSGKSMGTETERPGTSTELSNFNRGDRTRERTGHGAIGQVGTGKVTAVGVQLGDSSGAQYQNAAAFGTNSSSMQQHNSHNTTKFDPSEAKKGVEKRQKLLADMVRGGMEDKK